MTQRYCLNRQRPILVDDILARSVNGVKDNLIAQVTAEQCHLTVQHLFKLLVGVDMQLCRTSQETEGRNHAYQTEAMVTMQVRDKHMTYFREMHTQPAQLQLSTLATIHHKQFITQFNYLS